MNSTQTTTQLKTETKAPENPSRVRDHLANERTYLAWMRTAIALMGFGVVMVRLRHLFSPELHQVGYVWKLGLLFSLFGLITVVLSTHFYYSTRYAIDAATYEPSSRWIILFSLVILLLGAGVIYFIFTAPLDSESLIMPK